MFYILDHNFSFLFFNLTDCLLIDLNKSLYITLQIFAHLSFLFANPPSFSQPEIIKLYISFSDCPFKHSSLSSHVIHPSLLFLNHIPMILPHLLKTLFLLVFQVAYFILHHIKHSACRRYLVKLYPVSF